MKIELGKSYINAMGKVVRIIDSQLNEIYPYLSDLYSYTTSGIKLFGQESPQDLICEVVPEIYEAYTLGYILSQREFIEQHIKYWAEYEQNDL